MNTYIKFTQALCAKFNINEEVFSLPELHLEAESRRVYQIRNNNTLLNRNTVFKGYEQEFNVEANWHGVALEIFDSSYKMLIEFIKDYHKNQLTSTEKQNIEDAQSGKANEFTISNESFNYIVCIKRYDKMKLHLAVNGLGLK